jgi:hypothetical protein
LREIVGSRPESFPAELYGKKGGQKEWEKERKREQR